MREIWSAFSDEHGLLPIIDVTHASFRVEVPENTLAAMSQEFIDGAAQRASMSQEVREVLERSVLGGALAAASGSYLPGLSTYLLKLGPGNTWTGSSEIDRRIASSFPALATRIRLQDTAQMLAEGLGERLAEPSRPVCMVNIAGGTAADSWNALLCLQAGAKHCLAGRSIRIAVLDLDRRGPEFGARAIQALQKPDAPLYGLQINFCNVPYDWSDPARLPGVLREFGTKDALFAVSSEGGLFEYGDDDEIVVNLAELHATTPPDTFVVGSVTRDCDAVRAMGRIAAIRPRTIDAFRTLVERGGWTLNEAVERPFSFQVKVVKI